MKISDIVKGTDAKHQIVKLRHSRTARRRAEIMESMASQAEELRALSKGVQAREGLDTDSAINDVVQAINRLKSVI
jgi:hypothetical protein